MPGPRPSSRSASRCWSGRARSAHDELADLDISLFTTTHTPYTDSDQWLSTIGDVWVYIPTFYERGEHIVHTRLAIFDGGIKVDFGFLTLDMLADIAESPELREGYRVLLDKDGLTAALPAPIGRAAPPRLPTAAEFATALDGFWFEAYHVAKYLTRDELWMSNSATGPPKAGCSR